MWTVILEEVNQALGIEGVLLSNKGEVFLIFSKNFGVNCVKESREAKVMGILEGLRIFENAFQDVLIVESYL